MNFAVVDLTRCSHNQEDSLANRFNSRGLLVTRHLVCEQGHILMYDPVFLHCYHIGSSYYLSRRMLCHMQSTSIRSSSFQPPTSPL